MLTYVQAWWGQMGVMPLISSQSTSNAAFNVIIPGLRDVYPLPLKPCPHMAAMLLSCWVS